jgi:Mg-chelatase subunit ChlD
VSFILKNAKSNNDIDIMFTVDATGSMGDEIAYLKSELKNIMSRIDTSIEQKRVALTFYRDHGDQYVTRDFDFDSDIDAVKAHLDVQNAGGGGDYEEAVEEALRVSLAQSWNDHARSKLMFLMLDAPPHFTEQNVAMIKTQIKKAQEKGIRIIPVVASGANKNVEFLMRFFSVATNGTYVFLTDDSGIGNSHIEATTEDFKVEKLNDLIVRLIEKYAGVTATAV